MMEHLFHITSKDKIDSILEKGLIPGMGDNSSKVDDDMGEVIYLCEKKDIPYWSILLGSDSVMKVNTEGLSESDFNKFDYDFYSEWITGNPIDSSRISKAPMFIPKTDAMQKLCESYIFSLSDIIVIMTRLGTYPETCSGYVDKIKHDVASLLYVMENRLDFSVLNDSYIKGKMNAYGNDGEYTMCDMYCVTDRFGRYQLWDQLANYDFSNEILRDLKSYYMRVHKFVESNFEWVSEVHCGGYTGY